MYRDNKAIVQIGNCTSDPFLTTVGVMQACCLSPTFFKIYWSAALEHCIRKCRPMVIHPGDRHLHTNQFADDQI